MIKCTYFVTGGHGIGCILSAILWPVRITERLPVYPQYLYTKRAPRSPNNL